MTGLLFPKPAPRLPKEKRPLQRRTWLKRSTKPIARITPLKRSQKRIRPRRPNPRMQAWHDAVRARAQYIDANGTPCYLCFHCRRPFYEKQHVIGDHFPHNRSTHPHLKYDLGNGVCSCYGCNQKGSWPRARSYAAWKAAQERGETYLFVHTPAEYAERRPAA